MIYVDIIDNITEDSQRIDFCEAFEKQKLLVEQIIIGKRKETLWFLEHNSVFTAGKSVCEDEIFEDCDGIPVVKTTRGGKFTYHGPGQLIVYIFLNLKNVFLPNQPDLQKFIFMIEEWVMTSLGQVGVKNLVLKPEINHGVWIEQNKISAIGINVQKWVSSHGISININPEMKHFGKIIPCGVLNHGVTSLAQEGYAHISKKDAMKSLIQNFSMIFKNYSI